MKNLVSHIDEIIEEEEKESFKSKESYKTKETNKSNKKKRTKKKEEQNIRI